MSARGRKREGVGDSRWVRGVVGEVQSSRDGAGGCDVMCVVPPSSWGVKGTMGGE